MHQYHLGKHEEERDGEIVVCKVFLQKQPRRSTGSPAPGHGQKMVLLSPKDDQDDDLGSEAASESDSGFQELLLPSPGFKSDSPISVSGVTREILPTTPKLYARSARLQGNHSKAELTESTIPGIISLARSFEQHDARLAIQHKPESFVVRLVQTHHHAFQHLLVNLGNHWDWQWSTTVQPAFKTAKIESISEA
jgi:hypothetical protein